MRITKPWRNCSSRNYPWWIFWDSTTNETSVSGNSQPPNSARPITTPSKSTPTTRLKQASLIPTAHFLLFPKVITTHTPLYFNHEQGTFISCCLRTRRCRWVVYETERIWWRWQRRLWRQINSSSATMREPKPLIFYWFAEEWKWYQSLT